MSSRVRYSANARAVLELLRGNSMRAEIERRAKRMEHAAAAGGGTYRTDVTVGPKRVRAAVIGDYSFTHHGRARSREALLRALDAGRD